MSSQSPFPLMPPKSTEARMEHFDEHMYTTDPGSNLYKFLDTMCGDAGVGTLKKQAFVQRLSAALEGIYGSDLDYVFGNMRFLSRAPSESYPYSPLTDMLTAEQWDEVRVKDSWYRARVKEFMIAAASGPQRDGIRQCVHAATSVDCEIFEVWRYLDDFGLGDNLGRAPVSVRNEVVVKPKKSALEPQERRLLRDMLDKITPQDSIMTISTDGLSVSAPVPVRGVAADSSYYEVQKEVIPTPVLDSIPEPEAIGIYLRPSEKWMFKAKIKIKDGEIVIRVKEKKVLAPYALFNMTQEYCCFYLIGGGKFSPIDSVRYGTLQPDGSLRPEPPLTMFEATGQFGDWLEYERADSPDNYPGGKFGLDPTTAPAINPDHTAYVFPYASQADYVNIKKAEVLSMGGFADDLRYRLPITKQNQAQRTFTPDLAIAYRSPSSDSTITSSWKIHESSSKFSLNMRMSSVFVRS